MRNGFPLVAIFIIGFGLCACTISPLAEQLAAAKRATPPTEQGEFLPADWVDLATLDSQIRFDVRYATANNFLQFPVYTSTRMLLQRPAAEALQRAAQRLKEQGYGLLVHDAYRPWFITKLMWEITPADKHDFVADPTKGSRHNRGCAIDLSLYDLSNGQVIAMPSDYDEFSERASPHYNGGSAEARAHRDRLRAAMEAEGFSVYPEEWWHFDYKDWRRYAIQNIAADAIK